MINVKDMLFYEKEMNKHDAQPDSQQIFLQIEILYNCFTDKVTDVDPEADYKSCFRDNPV